MIRLVERAFAQSRDDNERKRVEQPIRAEIMRTSANSTLWTINWDIHPLPTIPLDARYAVANREVNSSEVEITGERTQAQKTTEGKRRAIDLDATPSRHELEERVTTAR